MSPHAYRIVVQGELGARYASAFDGMTLRAHDGETAITGPIIDQSHLHGLIARIASLGLTLHSLTPLETENAQRIRRPAARQSRKPGVAVASLGSARPGPGPRRGRFVAAHSRRDTPDWVMTGSQTAGSFCASR